MKDFFGNAASTEHPFGWQAEEAVLQARKSLATDLGAQSEQEILFTSGATESNNLAIFGIARAYRRKGNHIITVKTEHKAVLDPCAAWVREGGKVTYLSVDENGLIGEADLKAAITAETVLVSIMLANNEIGVLQPIESFSAITRERGIPLHTDATQAVGKIPIHVKRMGIDLLSFSGHKMYGPKGVGALYVSKKNPRIRLAPLIHGGGHERGMRSGTLNVPGIVGLAKALNLSLETMKTESRQILALRNRLWTGLSSRLKQLAINGHPTRRIAGNLNIAFPVSDIALLIREIYADIAVATGAACTSASPDPSHVLKQLPGGEKRSISSIRFGIGRFTTEEEIDYVIHKICSTQAMAAFRRDTKPPMVDSVG